MLSPIYLLIVINYYVVTFVLDEARLETGTDAVTEK
jgi:hypothetical protein